MASEPRGDGVCETSRFMRHKQANVFLAFAQADQLAQWWGPDGFTNTFEVFEFKPQGQWRFTMVGPDGQRYANQNRFLETSPAKVVIQHLSPPHFILTVNMSEQDGHTMLHWHQAFDDPAIAAGIWHIIEPSNEQNLDRLQALLARRASA